MNQLLTERESSLMRYKTWSAECNGTFTIIRAYLKKNALIAFREYDKSVCLERVFLSSSFASHACPVDVLVAVGKFYKVVMRESLDS